MLKGRRIVNMKKILAALLALVLCFGMLPGSFFGAIVVKAEGEYTWVDGTTVDTPDKGTAYYFNFTDSSIAWATNGATYGLITMNSGPSNGLSYHGTQYGMAAKAGNYFEIAVPGNCYVVVAGDNNSAAGATITPSSTTGAFDKAVMETKKGGYCSLEDCKAQGANSETALYVGEAGTVVLTLNDSTAYIPSICIIPASDDATLSAYEQKSFSLSINGAEVEITSGTTESDKATVTVDGGSVELVTIDTAIVWADLGGEGTGVLTQSMITGVSENITATVGANNTISVAYNDTSTNPTSFTLIVKDNSATGVPVADGSTKNFDFTNGSIISTLYTSADRLSGGKSVKSADGLITLTGQGGIYYNGSHGIVINANDTISVNVAGDATVALKLCQYAADDGKITVSGLAAGGSVDGAEIVAKVDGCGTATVEYAGDATTLVFTYTGGTGYIHSMSVTNAEAVVELPTSWDFSTAGGFTAAVEGTDVEYNSLKVTGKLRNNGDSAQMSEGTVVYVPVTGDCEITVVGHSADYGKFAINGVENTQVTETVVYDYTGSNGEIQYIEVSATTVSNSYIKSISIEYIEIEEAEELPTSWDFSSAGGFTAAVEGTDVEYNSLKVTGKLRNNGDSAQMSEGTVVYVPVNGDCEITVVGHSEAYGKFAINGVANTQVTETVEYRYTGSNGEIQYIEVSATTASNSYIKSISIEYKELAPIDNLLAPAIGVSETGDFNTSLFGQTGDIAGSTVILSPNKYIEATVPSGSTVTPAHSSNHGLALVKEIEFRVKVPANAIGVLTLNECAYASANIVIKKDNAEGEVVLAETSIDPGDSDKVDVDVCKYTNDTNTEQQLYIKIYTGSTGYVHGMTWAVEEIPTNATVSGTVSSDLNGEKLVFKAADGTKAAVAIADGQYSVELAVGTTYTVYFEKGLYRVTSEDTIDLTSASAGDSITGPAITHEVLANRLVIDANAITWNFKNTGFGAYGHSATTWYSGDGLVITGALALGGDGSHGASTSTNNTFTINVPAGLTTITFGGCQYDNNTIVRVTCGEEIKEVSLVKQETGKDPVVPVTITTDADASIVIEVTKGGGYLHYISAKTETVQPVATVSGTVDAAANGQVLNFSKDGAVVGTATVADGAYTVDLSVGSIYTVAFDNAAVYEILTGTEVDLTETAVGSSVTNDITFAVWKADKTFSIKIGDTTFNVTPGSSKAADFTTAVASGSGSVELSTKDMALVWANLGGNGSGTLNGNNVAAVSDNITTAFNGNVITVTYKDAVTNPKSYQITVKDNSASGVAVADGTPLNYDFMDGSVISKLYTNERRLLGGKSVKSTDGLITMTGQGGIYYNGSHGIYINANDSISVNVAGNATITFTLCQFANDNGKITVTGLAANGSVDKTEVAAKVANCGTATFEYTGDATTLVFTYTGGTGYIHSMSVTNKVSASGEANAQEENPTIKTYGTGSGLEVLPVGQRLVLTQTGGSMTTTNNAIDGSVSYYGFDATSECYKLEADIILNTCGNSNSNGIYFGAFDGTYMATIAIRKSTGLRGIYSKSTTDMAGAGLVDKTIEVGQKVHFVAQKTADGFIVTATPEGGETSTAKFEYNSSKVLLFKDNGIDTEVSYGFVVANANATVTNMKYYKADGTCVYSQNDCYAPYGTAPVVSGVTAEADERRENITVNWTSSVAAVGDGRYVIEVSKDGGAWTLIDEISDASLVYPITEAGAYTFRVCGKLGEEGECNAWVTSEVLDVIAALPTPEVSISSTATSVSLSWDAVSGAVKYEVYKYSFDEGEANATLIATVTTTSYKDTAVEKEMPYYYSVKAYSSNNYSNPSEYVWAVPTAGHTGDYVYEDDATEIVITKKSYDTVFSNKVVIEGVVMGAGTLNVLVNGDGAQSKTVAVNDKFSLELTVEEGRNDVELLFVDSNDNVTRKAFNFVYLTNYDKVVDATYTGTDGAEVNGIPTYKTVQAAVDSVSASNNEQVVIFVMAGSYEERLVVDKPYVSLIGEDRESTLIHFYPGVLGTKYEAGEDMDKRCATYIMSSATGFSAENISFANDYVYSTPDNKSNKSADALRCDADSVTFVNVKFVGVQDTLYMGSGHQYYNKCRIEGLVDFIYSGDDARSFFNDCEIVFVYESTKKSGYVCAPKTAENATYGLTFYNCVITAEEGCAGNDYLLARPWGPDAYITWINCYMGDVIYAELPYNEMSGNPYQDARFFEYGTYGPGFVINADRRQISQNKAAEMITDRYLGWSPATVSEAVAAKYVGDIETDRDEQFDNEDFTGSDKYQWTDGDDSGLAKYNQEGYAQAYEVTGGGLLKETSENYYKASNAKEFLDALLAIKNSGKDSVIEITADINLGCNEVDNFGSYSSIITAYGAQPLTHPTLLETGVSVLKIEDMYNFTIFSQNGSSIKHANITMKNSGNIIIRNIKFDELWEWDEDTDGNYDRNDWDYMTLDSGADGIWIDHCTFYKAYDGVVDIKNPAPKTNVTISWCEFLPGSEGNTFFNVMMDELKNNAEDYEHYSYLLSEGMTETQIYKYAYGQKKTHLLGQDDSKDNAAGIRATFANNVYLNSMDRMPRLRFGNAHVYNCIMDSQELLKVKSSISNSELASKIVSNGAASTCGGQMLLENCYISGILNALNSGNGNSPAGYINAVDSVYYINGVKKTLKPIANSKTDDRVLITNASAFVNALPYSDYILCNAETLDEYVSPYAGAGKLTLTVLQWEKESYNDSKAVVTPKPTPEVDDDIYDEPEEELTQEELDEANREYIEDNCWNGKEGWQKVGGDWYYFDEDGYLETGWVQDVDDRWYYMNNDGKMATAWVLSPESKLWYYMDTNNGHMLSSGWLCDPESNRWYYLDPNGAMCTGWILLDGAWYLLDNNGSMCTGWNFVNGYWYLLDSSGMMLTGWQNVGGKYYYMVDSGECLLNTTTPDGHKVDESGARID